MPVHNKDCPVHGDSEGSQRLKAVLDDVRKHSLLINGPGPWSAEEGENGVVHLMDGTGATRAWMPRSVYDEILASSKLEHKL